MSEKTTSLKKAARARGVVWFCPVFSNEQMGLLRIRVTKGAGGSQAYVLDLVREGVTQVVGSSSPSLSNTKKRARSFLRKESWLNEEANTFLWSVFREHAVAVELLDDIRKRVQVFGDRERDTP